MRMFNIKDSGALMRHLLSKATFDNWELVRAKVVKGSTYTLDGMRIKDFYDDNNLSENISWLEVKSIVFEIIRGSKTPLLVNIFLKNNIIFEDENSYMLNIIFANSKMTITTGVDYRNFELNNRTDNQWDIYVEKLLEKLEVSYEYNV